MIADAVLFCLYLVNNSTEADFLPPDGTLLSGLFRQLRPVEKEITFPARLKTGCYR